MGMCMHRHAACMVPAASPCARKPYLVAQRLMNVRCAYVNQVGATWKKNSTKRSTSLLMSAELSWKPSQTNGRQFPSTAVTAPFKNSTTTAATGGEHLPAAPSHDVRNGIPSEQAPAGSSAATAETAAFPDWLQRTHLLVGSSGISQLASSRVLLVGLGGVGSFAAEFLVRAGLGHLTIVDGDSVDLTNKNRQLPALDSTVGLPKAEVVAARLRDINPALDLRVINEFLDPETARELVQGTAAAAAAAVSQNGGCGGDSGGTGSSMNGSSSSTQNDSSSDGSGGTAGSTDAGSGSGSAASTCSYNGSGGDESGSSSGTSSNGNAQAPVDRMSAEDEEQQEDQQQEQGQRQRQQQLPLQAAGSFDYVVDCIDSIAPKKMLICAARQAGIKVISSMGAGGRMDPSRVHVVDLFSTYNDPFAMNLRKGLRRLGVSDGVVAVWSDEPVKYASLALTEQRYKKSYYGTISYIPALFGLNIAAHIIREVLGEPLSQLLHMPVNLSVPPSRRKGRRGDDAVRANKLRQKQQKQQAEAVRQEGLRQQAAAAEAAETAEHEVAPDAKAAPGSSQAAAGAAVAEAAAGDILAEAAAAGAVEAAPGGSQTAAAAAAATAGPAAGGDTLAGAAAGAVEAASPSVCAAAGSSQQASWSEQPRIPCAPAAPLAADADKQRPQGWAHDRESSLLNASSSQQASGSEQPRIPCAPLMAACGLEQAVNSGYGFEGEGI